MGLLDGMQQKQPAQGGLLGAFGAQEQQAQQDDGSLQMAMKLAESPTVETGRAIIAQMRQAGMPEADQIEAYLAHVGDDPQAIKQVAMQVVQALSQ